MSWKKAVSETFKKDSAKWLILIIFATVIFSINIWTDGIYSAQEGRAALVARNMLRSGNFMHISLKGAPETEKPIMCYWFYAVSGWIFGVNEFSVRLPSIIASIATVLMTCWLGMRIYGRDTGFMAGFLLATMIGFINLGRLARIDIVLCAFYTLTMIFLYTGYFENKRANWRLYLFYLMLALSVLIKGPVAVALAALTIIVLIIKERDLKIAWELKPVSGLIIGLVICAPWYIYEIVRTKGAFAEDFFLNQNLSRFTGMNMSYRGGKRQSYFYYLPKLFAGALPWSIFTPVALVCFWNRLRKFRFATYYLIIWFAVVFVFFSLAAIKRGDYVLPLYPALAILLGRFMIWLTELKFKMSKKWIIVWFVLIGAVVIAAIGVKAGLLKHVGQLAVEDKINHISQRDGMGMIEASNLINNNFILAAIGAAGILALLFWLGKLLEKGNYRTVVKIFIAGFFVFICVFYIWIDPSQNKYKTVKYFCAKVRQRVPETAKVVYYEEFITEALFFADRDYEYLNYETLNKLYDKKTNKLKYDYVITWPRALPHLPPRMMSQMEKVEETIPDHQYPLVLLKRKK